MKAVLFSLLLLPSFAPLFAQKEDYKWLSGYDSNQGYSSYWHWYYGTSIMDFNFSPRYVIYDSIEMNFSKTDISYCDANGDLLFYSNGVYVANKFNEKIENGDSLNAGYWELEFDPYVFSHGYLLFQGMLSLQNPADTNQYYLIHSYGDSTAGGSIKIVKTLVTLLDISANNGHGKVLYKNFPLIEDSIDQPLSATRHGNGRDWWILVKQLGTNCYYRILLDTTGTHVLPEMTCTGRPDFYEYFGGAEGAEVFSPDGNKFVHSSLTDGVTIYDFDRCSGTLSNPIYLPIDSTLDINAWQVAGVAISPNNRFLYVTQGIVLLQYDLNANEVYNSVDTVGVYDGYYDSVPSFNCVFVSAQLAPDGKIYMNCGNSLPFFHVINTPDMKGDSCNFSQRGIVLPSPAFGLANFPNYRLGALPGSPCDTLGLSAGVNEPSKENILRVYPNPASDVIAIDYGNTDWAKGEVSLEVTNELGQVVFVQTLPMYSGYQKLDIIKWSNGFYTAYIKRKGAVVAAQKFLKE